VEWLLASRAHWPDLGSHRLPDIAHHRGITPKHHDCPGMLVDQWQDELREKFYLGFEIVTRQMIDASYADHPLLENDPMLARLTHLSRSQELLAKLAQREWDLVICDEAQDVGAPLRQPGQGDQAPQAQHAPRGGDAPPAADEGDAAQRQARGL